MMISICSGHRRALSAIYNTSRSVLSHIKICDKTQITSVLNGFKMSQLHLGMGKVIVKIGSV